MAEHFIERPRYSCALGGAFFTSTALPETVSIVHSGSGCAGSFAWGQNGGSGCQVSGHCAALAAAGTNVQEHEVVFGGEDRLKEEIEGTLKVLDGKLYLVLTGCVTEIIGDDVNAVINEFKEVGVEIAAALTGGFKGSSYKGYDIVLKALIKDFVKPAQEKIPNRVNIFGIVPFVDPFWRGNLEGIRDLLRGAGIEANVFFTPDSKLADLEYSASASLNVVVSGVYGIDPAAEFERIHKTPYTSLPLPIGAAASASFVRAVSSALGIDSESYIESETEKYYKYLELLTDCYTDLDFQRYALVVGDSNYSVAVTKFLANEVGWVPVLAQCTDILTPEEQDRIKELLADGITSDVHVVFDTDGSQSAVHLKEIWDENRHGVYANTFSPAFVAGSSLERATAEQLGAGHLSISFPVSNRVIINRGYTGFKGGLTLSEDLLSVLVSPR
ncbi:nitrogenase component 1 [Seleniivibrio woodruffii]|uniref:Nitrogenase molybdenum-iron protein beta chain n=1 Tax=Seleniivibrio woodruffii TaxID=1078050 RepID=A0A4R1K9E8_9BACT|nr:nitrogenase component 1 [Seleniivibrio woodruffii]TCK61002.1 nitrogenase molybdenum-iron protein beta chain [Seleniivibrio woodruffii]TVZ36632.1 nitrogenase molybdenum-iron protein beta chain [Seleniivibrio woodruffii]